jgi:flagellar hook-basal body complex protein FliE
MMNPTNMANIESVLGQLRQYQALAENSNSTTNPIQNENGAGLFAESIKNAVQEVNETQKASKAIKAAYESGEDIPLTDVVMSIQKSSLAFEATLQVRNKVLKAYEEIMNMPV